MIYENLKDIQLTEIEVNYSNKVDKINRVQVHNSAEVYEVCKVIWQYPMDHRECSYALYFNRNNNFLGYFLVSLGGIDATLIDIKVVVQTALKINASAFIIAHNHPSCNSNASENDLLITKKLKEACRYLEIKFLDHLIVHSYGYSSMADEGLL